MRGPRVPNELEVRIERCIRGNIEEFDLRPARGDALLPKFILGYPAPPLAGPLHLVEQEAVDQFPLASSSSSLSRTARFSEATSTHS